MDKELHLSMKMRTDLVPLKFSFSSDIPVIKFTINDSGGGMLPYYDGAYVVDPRKVSQELDTENKSMRDNVLVNSIYYSEVLNPQGGNTVTIGLE
jgi:hypothetical protein